MPIDWGAVEKSDEYQAMKNPAGGASTPEARTMGNYASEVGKGLWQGAGDAVGGVMNTVMHPVNTAHQLGQQVKDFANTKEDESSWQGNLLKTMEHAPLIGGYVQQAEQGGPRYASPESIGAGVRAATSLGVAPYVAAKVTPLAIRTTGEGLSRLTPKGVATGIGALAGAVEGGQLGAGGGFLGGTGGAGLGHMASSLFPHADVPFSESYPKVNDFANRLRTFGRGDLITESGATAPIPAGSSIPADAMTRTKVALPGGKTQPLGDYLGVPKERPIKPEWVKTPDGDWTQVHPLEGQPQTIPLPNTRAASRAARTNVSRNIPQAEWSQAQEGMSAPPQQATPQPPPIITTAEGVNVHSAPSPKEWEVANWLNDNKARIVSGAPQDNLPAIKPIPEVSRPPLPEALGGTGENPSWLMPTKDTWTRNAFGREYGLDKLPTTDSVWGKIEPPNAFNNWGGIGAPSEKSNTLGRGLAHEGEIPRSEVAKLKEEPVNLMATAKPKGAPGFSGHRLGEDNVPRISEIRGGDQVANAFMNAKNNQFIDVAKQHLGEDVKPEDLSRSRAQHGDNLNPAKAALIGRILDRLTPQQIVEAFGGKWIEPKD